jgi:hypothetical protein
MFHSDEVKQYFIEFQLWKIACKKWLGPAICVQAILSADLYIYIYQQWHMLKVELRYNRDFGIDML